MFIVNMQPCYKLPTSLSQLRYFYTGMIMTVFIYSVGTEKPTIKSLNCYILNTIIANHWKDLGTELLKEENVHELTTIEKNHHNDVKICCREMFDYWLQVDCNANWNQLITALDKINLNTLAQKIKKGIVNG